MLFSNSGVLDVAYVLRDLEGFHLVRGEWAQQVNRWTRWVGVAIEPAVEVAWVKDDGHTLVHRSVNSFAGGVLSKLLCNQTSSTPFRRHAGSRRKSAMMISPVVLQSVAALRDLESRGLATVKRDQKIIVLSPYKRHEAAS